MILWDRRRSAGWVLVFALGCSDEGGTSSPTPGADTGAVVPQEDGGASFPDAASPTPDSGVGAEDLGVVPPSSTPNVLLIIADDLGLDASRQFSLSSDLPTTPQLDALAERGVVFENMWATPACTTTRASILTGQHGVHSGVTFVPASLRDDATTVQSFLRASPAGARYVNAVFGKWHVGGANPPPDHPNGFGVETYAGNVGGNLEDYFDWEMVRNQALERSTTYHTTAITDLALEWVMEQTRPWFLWVAYSAPHSPFHLPPSDLHSQPLSGNPADIAANRRAYYLTAIEAMDSEIGRLLESLPEATRDNTIVMFLGDNGTPRPVLDRTAFGNHGKNTLYEGGVRVPFIVAGSPLTRQGEREEALVNTTDLFATIATLTGATTLEHEDSVSFAHLLADAPGASRRHNYTEFESDDVTGWAVRNERYKLITFADGTQELYDVVNDIAETQNLLLGGGDFSAVLAELWEAAQLVRGGPMMAIDITGLPFRRRSSNCAEYAAQYRSDATDVSRNVRFNGSLQISVAGGKCVFATNEVPNHDFNDGARPFPNAFSDQSSSYEITAAPAFAAQPTALTLATDNAILLNGVKIDILAAGCFGVGNGRVGCNDPTTPWRYDPLSPLSGFLVDSHNAHTQPNGAYHYHGPPVGLFVDSSQEVSGVLGFAADGFPIFGPMVDDGGTIRRASPSYRLRSGDRPAGAGSPGGSYDGTYRDDYEYVAGLGDLDACNGMMRDGVYGYYVTETFPYLVACYRGTPDPSFNKR